MPRTIRRIVVIVIVIFIVAYTVNKVWRVNDGAGGGVIEQLLFGK